MINMTNATYFYKCLYSIPSDTLHDNSIFNHLNVTPGSISIILNTLGDSKIHASV